MPLSFLLVKLASWSNSLKLTPFGTNPVTAHLSYIPYAWLSKSTIKILNQAYYNQ